MITVSVATEVNDELVQAITRLLPRLSRSAPAPTTAELEEIVHSAATTMLLARDADGEIVGTLTLATFRIPTAVRAWIEDVIVDTPKVHGQGAGEALTRAALQVATEKGAKTVDLTSRPTRETANNLYQRVGFEARETNVYRINLG